MDLRMFAFIRAINTGNRRLTNDRLLEPFRSMGLTDVHAYQAAGNVAFRSPLDPEQLEVELTGRLGDAYGFDAPTFVRTTEELRGSIVALPFSSGAIARTQGKAQITFLASPPSEVQVAEALSLVPADDQVAFVGPQWFWLPLAGVSDSALPMTRLERVLGPMTMRTVGTIERMLARFPD